jgi:hypothetical protein
MALTTSSPGARWRILAKDGDRKIELENQGIFDELVIDHWLHLEQMDDNSWWARIGDASIHVVIDPSGRVQLTVERNVYGKPVQR